MFAAVPILDVVDHYWRSAMSGWPLQMEFIRGWMVCLLFTAGAIPIVLLGLSSLAGMGRTRMWTAISVRLGVLLLALLILAGVRWKRQHTDVEVMVLRDISESTTQVKNFPQPSDGLQPALDAYFNELAKDPHKKAADRIGSISFHQDAFIDALPNEKLSVAGHGVRTTGNGTDPATAIQLGLASMSKDAMHRMLLVWDGNHTSGDLDAALSMAAAQHVPIDVMPLRYAVTNEVLIDRLIAPAWKRENEPFTIDVILQSTNAVDVTGKLAILRNGEPFDERTVTLKPGLNRQGIFVPATLAGGVQQFRAVWQGDAGVDLGGAKQGDTLSVNNVADAFTFVQGEGQILYVDNVRDSSAGGGDILLNALREEKINLVPIAVDQFPNSLIQLTQYDAVILANVDRGSLGEHKQEMLARYVHEQSGGLVMIGGPNTFGAGGWKGSKLEEVLPVDMDIPAQRQIPQGAMILVVDRSGSMNEPFGAGTKQDAVNRAAVLALRTLSEEDLIGVVSFDGGAQWAFPLQQNKHANHLADDLKKIGMGGGTFIFAGLAEAVPALEKSGAAAKHILLLTDGQTQPADYKPLLDRMKRGQITMSTVGVGVGHDATLLKQLAAEGRGRYFDVSNPTQLPQVFIKEAMIVRRSLIQESDEGIPLVMLDGTDDFVKGLSSAQPLFGMVLTSRKKDPKVMMPIGARLAKDGTIDPILAHWQTGLGRAAVFTGDAHNKWGSQWVASSAYSKFWAQVVRGVARPPMSTDFDIQTTIAGGKGKIVVEAIGKDSRFLNFLTIAGGVLGPDLKEQKLRTVQTAPGRYEAEFDASIPGNYVAGMTYADRDGNSGLLRSGAAMNASLELRDLKSNDARLREVAMRTSGRVIEPPFNVGAAQLFRREGLFQDASPLPVWDLLMPYLLGLMLVDVAVRRIAWDWNSTRRMAASAAAFVRSYTTTRQVETRSTVDALAGIKAKAAAPSPSIDPTMKFEPSRDVIAASSTGDLTSVVGGAVDKPLPAAPRSVQPKGLAPETGDHLGGLMAAKRRAREQMKDKE